MGSLPTVVSAVGTWQEELAARYTLRSYITAPTKQWLGFKEMQFKAIHFPYGGISQPWSRDQKLWVGASQGPDPKFQNLQLKESWNVISLVQNEALNIGKIPQKQTWETSFVSQLESLCPSDKSWVSPLACWTSMSTEYGSCCADQKLDTAPHSFWGLTFLWPLCSSETELPVLEKKLVLCLLHWTVHNWTVEEERWAEFYNLSSWNSEPHWDTFKSSCHTAKWSERGIVFR